MSQEQPASSASIFISSWASSLSGEKANASGSEDGLSPGQQAARSLLWEDRACVGNAFRFLVFSEPAPVPGTLRVSQSTRGMKSGVKLSVLTSPPRVKPLLRLHPEDS